MAKSKAREKDMTICKACKKEVSFKSLIRHIGRSQSCKNKYGKEFSRMKAASRKETYTNYNKRNAENINSKQKDYDRKKTENQRVRSEETSNQIKWPKLAKTKEEETICKACKKEFINKTLLRHIGGSQSCKNKYGEEFSRMKAASRKETYTNYNKGNAENINSKQKTYDRKKAENPRGRLEEIMNQTKGPNKNENLMSGTNLDYKFFVIFDEIKLYNFNPQGCLIKFKCPLFSSFLSHTLEIKFANEEPKENMAEKLRGIGEIFKQRERKEKINEALKKHPLEIEIWKDNVKIGTGEAHLNELYPTEEFTEFKAENKCHVPIFKNKFVDELETVGSIDCIFILEGYDCIICKSCKKEFQASSILNHLTQVEKCKDNYSKDEIQQLENESIKRKKRKRKARYDPQKRAQLHKISYDPVKRTKQYQDFRAKEEMERIRKFEEYEKGCTWNWKESCHEKAKDRNKTGKERAKKHFAICLSQFKNINMSKEAEAKVKMMEEKIEEKYQSFEKEIAQTVKDVKSSWCTQLWGKLICTGPKSPAKLYKKWHELEIEIELNFKDLAKLMKVSYNWTYNCTCSKCKLAMNIDEKKKKDKSGNTK
jgi:hypothetical protein